MPVAAAGDGAEKLAALGARLKATGEKGLRLQLIRGLKAGAAPLIPLVHDAAVEKLPHRGGLNEQVAGQKVSVSVRLSARTAGVRMTTTAPDTAQTDSGFVRHPVFARRTTDRAKKAAYIPRVNGEYVDPAKHKVVWITQPIPNATGWWSDTLAAAAPAVQPELTAVMEQVSNEIQGV